MPNDGGGLILDAALGRDILDRTPDIAPYLRKFIGSDDSLYGRFRYCLWIENQEAPKANQIPFVADRVKLVKAHRAKSTREATKKLATKPHAFGEIRHREEAAMLVPRHSSEERQYLPFDLVGREVVIADSAIALSAPRDYELAIFGSRLHLVWIATVCGKLETRYRYSNTLGWNTFPVPKLTDRNKADLTRTAENILLAREAHFPATIAELYDPEAMPDDLRRAHEENDEVLERIYIGRRFRNDTERLEKLFDLYTRMTADQPKAKKGRKAA